MRVNFKKQTWRSGLHAIESLRVVGQKLGGRNSKNGRSEEDPNPDALS